MGTDPLHQCGTNAWPPDFNDSGKVDINDIVLLKPHFNKTSPDPNYSARFDLNADNSVNINDVVRIKPFFNRSCS